MMPLGFVEVLSIFSSMIRSPPMMIAVRIPEELKFDLNVLKFIFLDTPVVLFTNITLSARELIGSDQKDGFRTLLGAFLMRSATFLRI